MKKSGYMIVGLFAAFLLVVAANSVWAQPPAGSPGQEVQKHFEQMDANKDGKISLDEYLAGPKSHFKAMDTNADGFLTKDEIKEQAEKAKEKAQKAKGKRRGQQQ